MVGATNIERKKLIYGVLAVLLAGVVVTLLVLTHSSANGTVYSPVVNTPKAPVITSVSVHGQYISFKRPSNFEPQKPDKPSGNELEVFEYIKRPAPFYTLNIVVSSLPSGNLTDDGSYNFRTINNNQFAATSFSVNGQPVLVFSDNTQSYAKAAFMAHGNKDVSVALNASLPGPDADQILQTVLNTISWQ